MNVRDRLRKIRAFCVTAHRNEDVSPAAGVVSELYKLMLMTTIKAIDDIFAQKKEVDEGWRMLCREMEMPVKSNESDYWPKLAMDIVQAWRNTKI